MYTSYHSLFSQSTQRPGALHHPSRQGTAHLSEHPTTSPTSAGTLTLLAYHVHLVTLLDIRVVVGCEGRDRLRLLDVRTRDQFSFLQSTRVLKQFILEGVVDVLFDDDVFRVTLGGKRNSLAMASFATAHPTMPQTACLTMVQSPRARRAVQPSTTHKRAPRATSRHSPASTNTKAQIEWRGKRTTHRIPLPRQPVIIQRIWMQILAIHLDISRTVEINGQRRVGLFLLLLVQDFLNVLGTVSCSVTQTKKELANHSHQNIANRFHEEKERHEATSPVPAPTGPHTVTPCPVLMLTLISFLGNPKRIVSETTRDTQSSTNARGRTTSSGHDHHHHHHRDDNNTHEGDPAYRHS